MVLGKAQIPFHRRSRYEDILDLVNDSEEALQPFPDRDAVFYKASNKGSRFDGRQHLDKLKEEQSRISERHIRDHMMREYAHDKGLTHRSLFLPQRFNLGEEGDPTTEYVERFGNEDDEDDEYFDTEDMTPYLRSDLDTALARARSNITKSGSNSPSTRATNGTSTRTRRRDFKKVRKRSFNSR